MFVATLLVGHSSFCVLFDNCRSLLHRYCNELKVAS